MTNWLRAHWIDAAGVLLLWALLMAVVYAWTAVGDCEDACGGAPAEVIGGSCYCYDDGAYRSVRDD